MPTLPEFNFTLPRGYTDEHGDLHREGVMRLATAFDEIAPLKDPRVQSNPAYLTCILLSRVMTKLGDCEQITPKVIERLSIKDLDYLESLYGTINDLGSAEIRVKCPSCEEEVDVDVSSPGGSDATP